MRKYIICAMLLTIAAQGAWAIQFNYTPTQMNPKPTYGPWTYDTVSNEVKSATDRCTSLNGMDHSAWDKRTDSDHKNHQVTYQWLELNEGDDGLGFSICCQSAADTHYGVFSSYYHNELVPSFTRLRMTWNYAVRGKSTDLRHCVALYARDGLQAVKDEVVDCTGSMEDGRGEDCRLAYLIQKGKEAETARLTQTFDFDNRNGDSVALKQWALLLTHVTENTSNETDDMHQYGSFKSYGSSWTTFYYKQLSYAPNGGVGIMNNQEIENSGTLTANAFVRDGYTFVGWATTPDGAVVYTDGQAITVDENNKGRYVLYAIWKPTVALVESLINAIGETVYTAECKARIDDARAIYNQLSADEKSQVGNYGTLTDAEAAYAAVGEVMTKIAAIGEVAYPSSGATIALAKTAFDALSEDWKPLVINYNLLTDAEAQYAILGVEAKIAAIGTVEYTEECKYRIDAAREAYDNDLYQVQKMRVTNYATLLAAEAAYADLGKTALQFVGQDKTTPVGDSQRKSIAYPELPAPATKWQTVEKSASDKTIVIKAVQ